MAVPGKSHKYIGYYEEQDSDDSKSQHGIIDSDYFIYNETFPFL